MGYGARALTLLKDYYSLKIPVFEDMKTGYDEQRNGMNGIYLISANKLCIYA